MSRIRSLEEIIAEGKYKKSIQNKRKYIDVIFYVILLILCISVTISFIIPSEKIFVFNIWFLGLLFLVEIMINHHFLLKIEFSESRERTNALLKDIHISIDELRNELKSIKSIIEHKSKEKDI